MLFLKIKENRSKLIFQVKYKTFKTSMLCLIDDNLDENSAFRLQGKKIQITYSQPGNNWTKEFVLNNLNKIIGGKKNKIIEFVIGEEKHKDGNLHFHVVVSLKSKLNTRNSRFFDILDEEQQKIKHPNLKSIKTSHIYYQKILYSIKSGNYIKSENLDIQKVEEEYRSKMKIDSLLIELYDIVKEKGYHQAMDFFKSNTKPLMFMKECRRVSKILKEASNIWSKDVIKANYPNSDYKRIEGLEKAIIDRVSFWLSGETNNRKTNKVFAELEERNVVGILLKSNETLTNDQEIPENSILVCDDAFSRMPISNREDLIQLFDVEQKRELPGRFYNRKIPKGVPLIVISNETLYSYLKKHNCENDEAILRRIRDAHISEDLKININIVNIQGDNNQVLVENRPFAEENSSIPNRKKT